MAKNNCILNKDVILELLEGARELKVFYDETNKKYPQNAYNYGSVDDIALRLLEMQEGFIAIGIKLKGDDIRIYGRGGYLAQNGVLFLDNGTVEYTIKDFKGGTTISRFANEVSKVLQKRVHSEDPELRQIMMSTAGNYSSKIQKVVGQYIPNQI